MGKTLRNILVAGILGTMVLFNPIKSLAEEILNKTYAVPMSDSAGFVGDVNLNLVAQVNEKGKKFTLGIKTEDYNRKDWRGDERENLPAKHSRITYNSTGACLLHPPEVALNETQQAAYVIPDYRLEILKPLEESFKVKWASTITEKGIHFALQKLGLVCSEQIFDAIEKFSSWQGKRKYEGVLGRLKTQQDCENYVETEIEFYPVNHLWGVTETARSLELPFDMSKIEGKAPLYLYLNVGIERGNTVGMLENIVIPFSLNGEGKIEETEAAKGFEEYFFNKKEAKRLEEIIDSNSGMHLSVSARVYPYLGLETKDAGARSYVFPNDTQSNINQYVQVFATKYQAQKFISYLVNNYLENFKKYFIFNKENVVSFMSFDLHEQKSRDILLNTLFMYEKRIGAEFYFPDCYRAMTEGGPKIPLSADAFIRSVKFAQDMKGKSANEFHELAEERYGTLGKQKSIEEIIVYAIISQ